MLNSFLNDNVSTESLEDTNYKVISSEGLIRQVLGDMGDALTLKRLRSVIKVAGWTGWDEKRILRGIADVEREVTDMISQAVRKHHLGSAVSYEALDSWLATNNVRSSAVLVLLDDSAKKKLLKAVANDQLDLNGYGSFIDNLLEEITGSKVREHMIAKVATYDDMITLFKDSCDTCRQIVDISVKANGGKLPKYLVHQSFLGLNALTELALLLRSMIRRAV